MRRNITARQLEPGTLGEKSLQTAASQTGSTGRKMDTGDRNWVRWLDLRPRKPGVLQPKAGRENQLRENESKHEKRNRAQRGVQHRQRKSSQGKGSAGRRHKRNMRRVECLLTGTSLPATEEPNEESNRGQRLLHWATKARADAGRE
jgi:hypothetical protein